MKAKLLLWLKEIWIRIKKPFLYFCLFLALLSIAFIAGKCSTKKERALNLSNIVAARDSIKTYSVKIAGLENFVFEKNAIILNQTDAIKTEIIEKERLKVLHLKELITNAELSGTIQILKDSLKLPANIQFVTIKDTSGTYSAIRLPYEWPYSDKYVSLTTGIRLNKTGWFDLSIPISGIMSIGYKKNGLFKPLLPVGIFTSENPYLRINAMDILIIEKPKKFYQKNWFHLILGGAIVESANILLNK